MTRDAERRGVAKRWKRWLSPETGVLPVAVGLVLLAAWFAGRRLGWPPARELLDLLGDASERSDDDAEARFQSYYEALLGPAEETNPSAPGAEAFKDRAEIELRNLRGERPGTLRPNASIVLHGHALSTNSRGMPDRERLLDRTGHEVRLAWVGESWTAGWGVAREDRYPDRFARFLERGPAGNGYESLNFSVPGNSPPVHLRGLREGVLPFDPDLVLLVSPPADARRVALDTARMLREGIEPEAAALRAILEEAGARPGRTVKSLYRRLAPRAPSLLAASIAEARRLSTGAGAAFACVLLPVLSPYPRAEEERGIVAAACEDGDSPLLDLSDAFEGEDRESLLLSPVDAHPNARAHALLDRAFRRALAREGALLERLRLRPEDLADGSGSSGLPPGR